MRSLFIVLATLVGVSVVAATTAVATNAVASIAAPSPAPRADAASSASAAVALLDSLDGSLRKKVQFEFADKERSDWHYVPKDRHGVSLSEMNLRQRSCAHALLRSALSEQGYLKSTAIMALDQVLREMEERRGRRAAYRDAEKYWFSIFGTPSPSGPWGWRVEGHHLSLNFTAAGGKISATPMFLGANPALVTEGVAAGQSALGREESLAHTFLASLKDAQRAQAIISKTAPSDVQLTPGKAVSSLAAQGLLVRTLTPEQRGNLWRLVELYAANLRPDLAERELTRLRESEFEPAQFAWAGSTKPGERCYYRLQGPSFCLEFDRTEPGQPGHVHTLWRDDQRDFGAALETHRRQQHRTIIDDPPKEPSARARLDRAINALRKARSYAAHWRFDIGYSDSKDHALDVVAFMQDYEAVIHGSTLSVPVLDLFRNGNKGVIKGLRGWQSDEGHIVGKWIAQLLVRPEILLDESKRGRSTWTANTAGGGVVAIELPKKIAARHWERVIRSRCMAGKGEDTPEHFGRIEQTRIRGRVEVVVSDEDRPTEINVVISVALSPKPPTRGSGRKPVKPKADFETEEHLVVKHRYRLTRIGSVEPILIPADAKKALR